MKRRAILLAAVVLVVVVCLAQTTTPPAAPPPVPPAAISAYYRLLGNGTGPYPYQWMLIDDPLSLYFDGVSPHLGLSPGYPPPDVSGDLSVTSYRTGPPPGPGPCTDGFGVGPRGWATDADYLYVCVQAAAPATGFVWARVPVETTW